MTLSPEVRAALAEGPLADLRDPAEVVASELVYEGRVWDIRSDTFRFGGVELTRDYMDHTGAVAVLAIDDDERILLINQYRHPIRSREWELPAGLLDLTGESPQSAAERELAEEVDLVASRWRELITFAASPGGSDEHVTIFEARGLSASPETFARDAEEAEIVMRWVPLAEAVEAALAGRIRNSILLLAVLTAHARG